MKDSVVKRTMKSRIEFLLTPFVKFAVFNASVAFCLGIVLSESFSVLTSILGLFILALIFLVTLFVFKARVRMLYLCVIGIFTLFFLLGIFRVVYFEYVFTSKRSITRFTGLTVKLTGVIQSEVEESRNTQRIVINPEHLELVGDNVTISTVNGRVLVTIRETGNIAYGDKITVTGVLEDPPEFKTFSYKDYLKAQGVFVLLKGEELQGVKKGRGNKILIALNRVKQHISSRITEALPQPHASLLSGIIYGEESSMGEEFSQHLRRTGTIHIIAVSGYNITVLISSLGVFSSLVGRCRLNIISIIFIILFMFFVGVDNIPVVRASFMGIVFMISQIFGKKRAIVILFPFTVAILLFLNPLTYKLISFQLSFLSTLGLVLSTDLIKGRISFIPEFFREDVSSTFAAILFTLPVTLRNFGEVSIIAPLVNFFVLPVVPIITVYGLLFVIILVLCFPVARVISPFLWLSLEYLIEVIRFFGGTNFAMITIGEGPSSLLSYMLSIILLLISFEISLHKKIR